MTLAGDPNLEKRLVRQERRRRLAAVLLFALAYAAVCALVAAPKGMFLGGAISARTMGSAQTGGLAGAPGSR